MHKPGLLPWDSRIRQRIQQHLHCMKTIQDISAILGQTPKMPTKIIRKKTKETPSLMEAAMKMLKIMVGKNCLFKERLEARPCFSWQRRLDSGELLDLTIVCSTDHGNAIARCNVYVYVAG